MHENLVPILTAISFDKKFYNYSFVSGIEHCITTKSKVLSSVMVKPFEEKKSKEAYPYPDLRGFQSRQSYRPPSRWQPLGLSRPVVVGLDRTLSASESTWSAHSPRLRTWRRRRSKATGRPRRGWGGTSPRGVRWPGSSFAGARSSRPAPRLTWPRCTRSTPVAASASVPRMRYLEAASLGTQSGSKIVKPFSAVTNLL